MSLSKIQAEFFSLKEKYDELNDEIKSVNITVIYSAALPEGIDDDILVDLTDAVEKAFDTGDYLDNGCFKVEVLSFLTGIKDDYLFLEANVNLSLEEVEVEDIDDIDNVTETLYVLEDKFSEAERKSIDIVSNIPEVFDLKAELEADDIELVFNQIDFEFY